MRTGIVHTILAHARIGLLARKRRLPHRRWLLHCGNPVADRAIVNRAQIHGRDIFLVGVEDHVAGHAVVLLDVGQRVVNAGAIQAGLADRIQQRVHCVISQRSKLLGLLVKLILKAAIEADPALVLAGGIVRKDRLKSLGRISGLSQQGWA